MPFLFLVLVLAVVLLVPPVRRAVLTRWLMPMLSGVIPRMSDTERIALEAGTVWWDAELFSGNPDWRRLLSFQAKKLTDKERAFLAGPTEQLCRMVDEWEVNRLGDLPPEAWAFLKKEKFFGMIIPEEFGGLGFSAAAHSAVITKISSRSVTASVTAMIPNSLGPAELLLHYGTDEQKRHYLPRLARGEEIPAFALTEPEAGSDATSQKSEGIVCKGMFEGREVIGMRLNWSKRYITLAPYATVLGLAFRLRDPDKLLGGKEDLGITCALLPTSLPGVEVGLRHDPLGVPFLNGPTIGKDVFAPIDFIFGGPKNAGMGWRMLMETLAAGRGIALPSLAVGCAQLSVRAASAHASVREQFGMPIGRFEGIEEPLARIGGNSYWMDSTRRLTLGAVDAGERPAVLSAIVKHYLTEAMRATVNDAMDVQAGNGISRGPRNVLASAYQAVPVGITVEGANILTRTLIIYGQGAIRCHPWVQKEMKALAAKDLAAFDEALFGHMGMVVSNAFRSFLHAVTGGAFAPAPVTGPAGDAIRRLARASAAFALVSDAAMATLGGSLKRKEKISGRLADALAWTYIGSATVKRYVDDGQPEKERVFFEWAMENALHRAQTALVGVLDNLPNRAAAWGLRLAVFPFGPRWKAPSDRLGSKVAKAMMDDRELRVRMTGDVYIPPREQPGLGRLEDAYEKAMAARGVERKLRDAIKSGAVPAPGRNGDALRAAVEKGVLTQAEADTIRAAVAARLDVIQVDSFDAETFAGIKK
ncbi:MAG TPA: acyl-CoA dehydrogenase [Candidatus Eisenbacteria bacterium]|nr:acyl-CoA dehydrogenase [Candidatus Eisenbacteria bacterium]